MIGSAGSSTSSSSSQQAGGGRPFSPRREQVLQLPSTTTAVLLLANSSSSPSNSGTTSNGEQLLTNEEYNIMAQVRRTIWVSGFHGLWIGSLSGIVLHSIVSFGTRRKLWKLDLNRSTMLMSTLLGGSIGSFLMSLSTGKNQVHHLHPVFDSTNTRRQQVQQQQQKSEWDDRTRTSNATSSTITRTTAATATTTIPLTQQQSKEEESSNLLSLSSGMIRIDHDENPLHNHTSTNTSSTIGTKEGQSIPDHENHNDWKEKLYRNRLLRRISLSQKIEKQHGGLNDAHGGHWVNSSNKDESQK